MVTGPAEIREIAISHGRAKKRNNAIVAILSGAVPGVVLSRYVLPDWKCWFAGLIAGLLWSNAFEYAYHRWLLHRPRSSFGRGHLDHHMNVGTPGEPEHVSLGRRRFHIALCTSNRKLTDRVSTCDRYDDAFVSSRLIALFHSIQRNSFAGDRAIQICDSANGFPCKPASTPLIT
jgi:hypothetical protein